MSYVITKRHLDRIGACKGQKESFLAKFGDSVDITKVDRDLLKEYDWDWYTVTVLKKKKLNDYVKRRNEALDNVAVEFPRIGNETNLLTGVANLRILN